VREPVWIDERDTLALHDWLLALDGGAVGVRNAGLLQSALARPQQLHAYGDAPDTQAVLGLAAGAIDEASFTRWLRANVSRSPR
jgi:prophage maintenance system killer protein